MCENDGHCTKRTGNTSQLLRLRFATGRNLRPSIRREPCHSFFEGAFVFLVSAVGVLHAQEQGTREVGALATVGEFFVHYGAFE